MTDHHAGYHRLWAHSCYKATFPLRLYLAAVGAGAVEGSIRWWSRGHRAHHRYTDTVKDPYSVRKGLAWSHMGWMIMRTSVTRHSDSSTNKHVLTVSTVIPRRWAVPTSLT